MQVQSIQTTNNYQHPNFKATFVNDAKGYFNKLWYHSEKTSRVRAEMSALTRHHENHKLEIMDVEKGPDNYLHYYIFNHHTGKYTVYNQAPKNCIAEVFCNILKKLNDNEKDFYEDYKDGMSITYRALTGQDVPIRKRKPLIP